MSRSFSIFSLPWSSIGRNWPSMSPSATMTFPTNFRFARAAQRDIGTMLDSSTITTASLTLLKRCNSWRVVLPSTLFAATCVNAMQCTRDLSLIHI